mgnify:CR=1 FL=1
MNINEMTIGQAKELAAMFSASNAQPQQVGSNLIGQKVIVRASSAGVHYGTLVSIIGDTVSLTNARRLWRWRVKGDKGVSLSDVADLGIDTDSKICAVTAFHVVIGACEVMSTTEICQKLIEGANVYNP